MKQQYRLYQIARLLKRLRKQAKKNVWVEVATTNLYKIVKSDNREFVCLGTNQYSFMLTSGTIMRYEQLEKYLHIARNTYIQDVISEMKLQRMKELVKNL